MELAVIPETVSVIRLIVRLCYFEVSDATKVSQKYYIKYAKNYVIHVFHTKIKKVEKIFCCHFYINLSTVDVDNCVDKSVIFVLYILLILWYNDGDIERIW